MALATAKVKKLQELSLTAFIFNGETINLQSRISLIFFRVSTNW